MCDVIIASGEVRHEAVDLDLPGFPPFELKRTYSSISPTKGPLGLGWSHNLDVTLVLASDTIEMKDESGDTRSWERAACDGKKGPAISLDKRERTAELVFPDGSRRIFERNDQTKGAWLQTRKIETHPAVWREFGYAGGRLILVSDSDGKRVACRYDQGYLVEVRAAARGSEARVGYGYDSAGCLTEAIDPFGVAERFEYDRGHLVRHTSRSGVARFFCYDEEGRCLVNWYQKDMRVRWLDWFPEGGLALVKDSYGYRDQHQLTRDGSPEMVLDPLGRTTRWVYTKDGALLAKLLPDGTPDGTALWNPESSIRTAVDLRGSKTEYVLGEGGQAVSIRNAMGYGRTYNRNAVGDVVEITAPGGVSWSFEYDDRGALARVIAPTGYWVRRQEGPDGIRISDSLGEIGTYRYDGLGNLLADTDAMGRTIRYQYAGQDRVVQRTNRGGGVARWQHDGAGRIIAFTDEVGRTTRFEYGVFGTLIGKTYADGGAVKLVLDKEDHILEILNTKGESTSVQYDAAFRQVRIVFFDGRIERQVFDSRNRVVERIDGHDETTRLTYDGAFNPVRIDLPDGTILENTFDGIERLVEIASTPPKGSAERPQRAEFQYDGANRITAEVHDGFEVAYEYDAAGALVGISDSSGRRIAFEVNGRGCVTKLSDGGRLYKLAYSSAGELLHLELPNGMSQHFTFDVSSRVVRREVRSQGGALLAWRTYAYDHADQLVGMEDWCRGAFRYEYDLRGRLVAVKDARGATIERYVYDLEGNILGGPAFGSASFARGNRLTTAGPAQYSYDGGGCLIAKDEKGRRWGYHHGPFNKLREITVDGATRSFYEYDHCGRRTLKRVAGEEWVYSYHLNQLAAMESARGARWEFLFAPEALVPLAQATGNRCWFYSFDQIGTPTELWNEEGQLVARVHAAAFGWNRRVEYVLPEDVPVPMHFQGQFVDDESGLHYNRFRYYDPATARFTTHDPVGLSAGLNLYNYPRNPLNWIDPLGLMPTMINCHNANGTAWTPCEQYAAQQKLDAINKTSKSRRKKTCSKCRENKQAEYFKKQCGGNPPTDFDVDHTLELQLGGADNCCDNLVAIPKRVNRSFGSQIRNAIEGLAEGAAVPQFAFNPPGCTQADQCQDKAGSVVRGGKSDGKDCAKEPPLDC